jgi:hypothetical protein
LQAAAAWPFFAAPCAAGRPGSASVKVLTFALTAAAVVTAAVVVNPRDAFAGSIANGTTYRDEMFQFVYSGGTTGEEASPRQYLPKHALHFGAFAVLCAATVGFGALVLGAYLLNYMSFYVGSLGIEGAANGSMERALLFAWAPYAIVRVVAYAFTGSAVTAWILGPKHTRRVAFAWGLAGVLLAVVDVVAKAFLARGYGETLREALTQR